jgi:hypothetical protein
VERESGKLLPRLQNAMESRILIPRCIFTVLNQLYELEKKLAKHGDPANLGRNLAKIKDAFFEEGIPVLDSAGEGLCIRLAYEDPLGQPFKETRTDLESTISGAGTEKLVVVEVIKPIIRATVRDDAIEFSRIVQKGVVVVESQKKT